MKLPAAILILGFILTSLTRAQTGVTVRAQDIVPPIVVTNLSAAFDGGTIWLTMIDANQRHVRLRYLNNTAHKGLPHKPILLEDRQLPVGSDEQAVIRELLRQWYRRNLSSIRGTTDEVLLLSVLTGLHAQAGRNR